MFLFPSLSTPLTKLSAATPEVTSVQNLAQLRRVDLAAPVHIGVEYLLHAKTSFLLYFFSVFVSSVLHIASRRRAGEGQVQREAAPPARRPRAGVRATRSAAGVLESHRQ